MPRILLARPVACALLTLTLLAAILAMSPSPTHAAGPTADAADAAGAADAARAARGTAPVPVRIATFNIQKAQPLASFEAGVDMLLPRVDVMGLQEILQKDRHEHLDRLRGWGSWYPSQLRANPVVWNQTTFSFVGGRGRLLARGRSIGQEKPRAGEFKKDDYATVVHLRHRATGQLVSVVNVHLIAGATSGGRPRKERPRMFSIYRDQVRALAALVRDEQAAGARVFVLGDFNVGYQADARRQRKRLPYANLSPLGLVSMWRDCGSDGAGTHGPQYIDQVWSAEPAAACSVEYDVHHSDHFPAIGIYGLDPVG